MKTSSKFLIAGCTGMLVCIMLFILIVSTSSQANANTPIRGIIFVLTIIGFFASINLLIVGFKPYITRIKSKIQSESIDYAEQEIAEASNKTVDVSSTAIEKVAKIVAKANEQETIFCEYCGTKLNADAKFCSNCGAKIEKAQNNDDN